jgi:hypothetical protein
MVDVVDRRADEVFWNNVSDEGAASNRRAGKQDRVRKSHSRQLLDTEEIRVLVSRVQQD